MIRAHRPSLQRYSYFTEILDHSTVTLTNRMAVRPFFAQNTFQKGLYIRNKHSILSKMRYFFCPKMIFIFYLQFGTYLWKTPGLSKFFSEISFNRISLDTEFDANSEYHADLTFKLTFNHHSPEILLNFLKFCALFQVFSIFDHITHFKFYF